MISSVKMKLLNVCHLQFKYKQLFPQIVHVYLWLGKEIKLTKLIVFGVWSENKIFVQNMLNFFFV